MSRSALPDGLRTMTDWLRGHGVTAAALEGTGVYWQAPFEALEDAGILAGLTCHVQAKLEPLARVLVLPPSTVATRPYLVLTKPLRLDIQCQRGASVKIGWKYLDD